MTQKKRLLEYLAHHKTINPLESWIELGIYRLSAVILLLKKDGYNIVTDKVKVKKRIKK